MNAVNVALPQSAASSQKRVAVSTLGCKVNSFESELIAQNLTKQSPLQESWRRVCARDTADLVIVNTCTVTREADRQARQEVRRAVRRNPDALIVVTGCYAQMDAQACADIPGVDLVLGNDRKLDVHHLLPALQANELPKVMVGDLDEQISLPDALLEGYEGQTRAFVQIQQGCDQGCTFCIIHRARGPSRSLPPTLVKRQVQRLLLNDYKEIVICGVDLGAYGKDFPDSQSYGFENLLAELAGIEGDFRLRLSSIDPAHLTDELIELLASEAKLCPHLHLSLQSGNTLILKRMKRRYHREHVYERVAKLRHAIPNLVLSADVMAGFPTETEQQFEDTVNAVKDLEIAYPHVFAYSQRSGTPAARIPNQIAPEVRKRRARELRELGHKIRGDVFGRNIGLIDKVLIEGGGQAPKGHQRGRMPNYLPVYLPASEQDIGRFMLAQTHKVEYDHLIARPST